MTTIHRCERQFSSATATAFSRGIDVEGVQGRREFRRSHRWPERTSSIPSTTASQRTKPLVAAVHGDTWKYGSRIVPVGGHSGSRRRTRISVKTRTRMGAFPGGGSTVRFVSRGRAGATRMRYMLTGDHWTADDAYRMGILQEIAETPPSDSRPCRSDRQQGGGMRAPLGIQTTLVSAHLAIDFR